MAAFETTLVLSSALGLGALHAFEIDHMTAVGAFVASRPRAREAVGFGAKWAMGHAVSLLLFGSLIFALKLVVSDSLSHWLERLVGVALVGVGLWTLYKVRDRGVLHSHSHGEGAFWMGILHGMAGTAAFVGESIVVFSSSYAMVAAFTVAFSLGVLASMAAYSVLFGGILTRAGHVSHSLSRGARAMVGLWSCGLGLFWIFR